MTRNSSFAEKPKPEISLVKLARDPGAFYDELHKTAVAEAGRKVAAAEAEEKGLTLVVLNPFTLKSMTNTQFEAYLEDPGAHDYPSVVEAAGRQATEATGATVIPFERAA